MPCEPLVIRDADGKIVGGLDWGVEDVDRPPIEERVAHAREVFDAAMEQWPKAGTK